MSINFKRATLTVSFLLLTFSSLQARWWIFGKASGRPELLKVFIGGQEARGDGKMALFREHLKDGRLEIKGFFRPAPGAPVAQVRVSLDNGATWLKNTAIEKDHFLLSAPVAPEQTGILRVELTDIKGQQNDPGDLPKTVFTHHDQSAGESAIQSLLDMAGRYADRDFRGFTRYLSSDFRGDLGSLEDAVARDFRSFRQINASLIPQQTLLNGADVKVAFLYDMSAIKESDGSVVKTNGQASYTLRWEDERFVLLEMPDPVIFGSSARTDENPTAGGGGPVTGGSTLGGRGGSSLSRKLAPGVIQGSGSISQGTGFNFDTRNNAPANIGQVDLGVNFGILGPFLLSFGNTVAIGDVGTGELLSIDSAQPGSSTEAPALAGHTYVLKSDSGRYSLFRVIAVTAQMVTFDFFHQTNGTSSFTTYQ
jgi:hypothetical protein